MSWVVRRGNAVICPVCHGRGRVEDNFGRRSTCRGCGGRGWVEVHDEIVYYTGNVDSNKYQPMISVW